MKGGEDMRDKICGIYMITNLVTGDNYVGQSKDVQYRWWLHKSSRTNTKRITTIGKAIKEYGVENFKLEVLEKCSFENLDERERYYISKLKPTYNIFSGGKAGFEMPESVKEQCRQGALKQWNDMSEEQKQHVIKHQLKGPGIGHKVSESTREKLRQANLGKKYSKETAEKRVATFQRIGYKPKPNYKKCKCVETGEVFNSVQEAAKFANVNPGQISKALNGKTKSSGGYHWEKLQ